MRMAFFFDQSRCMGCNSCTVACKDYYNVNPGPVRYRKQYTHEVDNNDGTFCFYSFVMACNHCETPACMSSCPVSAITKRADGLVVVNRDKCIESRVCISACPFGEPGIADDRQESDRKTTWTTKHPMQKCSMCAELMDKGESPVCVRSCPMHAIEVGDFNELKQNNPNAEELSFEKYPYAYVDQVKPNTSTGPSLLIKPRKQVKVEN